MAKFVLCQTVEEIKTAAALGVLYRRHDGGDAWRSCYNDTGCIDLVARRKHGDIDWRYLALSGCYGILVEDEEDDG